MLALMLLSAPAFSMNLFADLNPPAGGEDDFILAPVGAIEFNPSTKDNYGLAISESIAFARVLPGQDNKHVIVAPYGFFGIFGAANIGKWVDTNGGAAWLLDYGLMVGLPKLDEGIPEVAFSWNIRDNSLMINVAFPADILPAFLVHKL
jgi:hypothetical protein